MEITDYHAIAIAIADRKPSSVVCLDRAFRGNEQLKGNAAQTFAKAGVEK